MPILWLGVGVGGTGGKSGEQERGALKGRPNRCPGNIVKNTSQCDGPMKRGVCDGWAAAFFECRNASEPLSNIVYRVRLPFQGSVARGESHLGSVRRLGPQAVGLGYLRLLLRGQNTPATSIGW